MILSFFTGSKEVPPLGLPHTPALNFSCNSPFPTASTCAIELTLPTIYDIEDDFETSMNTAFLQHGGFGLS